jgi:putative autotransporter adhesin-like protein
VTRLDVGSAFDVRVAIGQEEAAMVTYDDDLADRLDVGVDGGTLHLRLRPPTTVADQGTLRAEVTLRQLEAVRVGGASTVEVTGKLRRSDLRLEISGSSRLAADLGLDRADATVSGASRPERTGTTGRLEADGSGASRLELAALRLQDLDIQLSGASHASVQADRTITAQVSGASNLTYKGAPEFTRRDTSGASTIQPA